MCRFSLLCISCPDDCLTSQHLELSSTLQLIHVPALLLLLLSNKHQLTKNGELISEQRRVAAPAIKKNKKKKLFTCDVTAPLDSWRTSDWSPHRLGLVIGWQGSYCFYWTSLSLLSQTEFSSVLFQVLPPRDGLSCSEQGALWEKIKMNKGSRRQSLHGEVGFTGARRRSQNGDLVSDFSARTDGGETDVIFQLPHWSLYFLCFH